MSLTGRVTHIGVCVSDLERALRFWTALGFERSVGYPEGHHEGPVLDSLLRLSGAALDNVFIERDGFRLELLVFGSPRSAPVARDMSHLGFTHISIRVPDIERAAEAVAAAGGTVLPDTLIEVGGRKVAIFLRDPDGLPIELTLGS
ncbi:MAG TPA: VOC family protein [Candidatus Binatia bacterium]|nr:VOC family protein [Candidatus Binatia bacterium]